MTENTTTKPGLEERLRGWHGGAGTIALCTKAADEIARLAAERDALRDLRTIAVRVVKRFDARGWGITTEDVEAFRRALNAESTS